jgi:hypothetical protein
MQYILTAMQREADSLGIPCKVIGIKATDLPETTEEDIIVNIGYCGAIEIPVGTVVEPDEAANYDTAEGSRLKTHFDCLHVPCFTADKFVTEPCCLSPSVYDMELEKITALPHKELYVLKIVSDNLDEAFCESFDDESAWNCVREKLKEKGLI